MPPLSTTHTPTVAPPSRSSSPPSQEPPPTGAPTSPMRVGRVAPASERPHDSLRATTSATAVHRRAGGASSGMTEGRNAKDDRVDFAERPDGRPLQTSSNRSSPREEAVRGAGCVSAASGAASKSDSSGIPRPTAALLPRPLVSPNATHLQIPSGGGGACTALAAAEPARAKTTSTTGACQSYAVTLAAAAAARATGADATPFTTTSLRSSSSCSSSAGASSSYPPPPVAVSRSLEFMTSIPTGGDHGGDHAGSTRAASHAEAPPAVPASLTAPGNGTAMNAEAREGPSKPVALSNGRGRVDSAAGSDQQIPRPSLSPKKASLPPRTTSAPAPKKMNKRKKGRKSRTARDAPTDAHVEEATWTVHGSSERSDEHSAECSMAPGNTAAGTADGVPCPFPRELRDPVGDMELAKERGSCAGDDSGKDSAGGGPAACPGDGSHGVSETENLAEQRVAETPSEAGSVEPAQIEAACSLMEHVDTMAGAEDEESGGAPATLQGEQVPPLERVMAGATGVVPVSCGVSTASNTSVPTAATMDAVKEHSGEAVAAAVPISRPEGPVLAEAAADGHPSHPRGGGHAMEVGAGLSALGALPPWQYYAPFSLAPCAMRLLPPPAPPLSICPALSHAIDMYVIEPLSPSLVSLHQRRLQLQRVAQHLVDAVRHELPNTYGAIRVYIFGSVNLRVVLPDGDNDVTMEVDGLEDDVTAGGNLLGVIRKYLNARTTPIFVEALVPAEVRVLKLVMEHRSFDITVGQRGGVAAVRFLHVVDQSIGHGHLFKRTLLLLKAWCNYEAHILGGHGGYIGSYAATTMLIAFINTVAYVEDGDEGDRDGAITGTPTLLLARFLEFYAYFDFAEYVVTIFGPLPLALVRTGATVDLHTIEHMHGDPPVASAPASSVRDAFGLTEAGVAALGHRLRRRRRPVITTAGVKAFLRKIEAERGREAARRAAALQGEAAAAAPGPEVPMTSLALPHDPLDTGSDLPMCTTSGFSERIMNVQDPLRWNSNMCRGVNRTSFQRIRHTFVRGLELLVRSSATLQQTVLELGQCHPQVPLSGPNVATAEHLPRGGEGEGAENQGVTLASGNGLTSVSPSSTATASPPVCSSNAAADGDLGTAPGLEGVWGDSEAASHPSSRTAAPTPFHLRRVLRMLFPGTLHALQRSRTEERLGAMADVERVIRGELQACASCSTPSVFCCPQLHHVSEPQFEFLPPVTSPVTSTQLRATSACEPTTAARGAWDTDGARVKAAVAEIGAIQPGHAPPGTDSPLSVTDAAGPSGMSAPRLTDAGVPRTAASFSSERDHSGREKHGDGAAGHLAVHSSLRGPLGTGLLPPLPGWVPIRALSPDVYLGAELGTQYTGYASSRLVGGFFDSAAAAGAPRYPALAPPVPRSPLTSMPHGSYGLAPSHYVGAPLLRYTNATGSPPKSGRPFEGAGAAYTLSFHPCTTSYAPASDHGSRSSVALYPHGTGYHGASVVPRHELDGTGDTTDARRSPGRPSAPSAAVGPSTTSSSSGGATRMPEPYLAEREASGKVPVVGAAGPHPASGRRVVENEVDDDGLGTRDWVGAAGKSHAERAWYEWRMARAGAGDGDARGAPFSPTIPFPGTAYAAAGSHAPLRGVLDANRSSEAGGAEVVSSDEAHSSDCGGSRLIHRGGSAASRATHGNGWGEVESQGDGHVYVVEPGAQRFTSAPGVRGDMYGRSGGGGGMLCMPSPGERGPWAGRFSKETDAVTCGDDPSLEPQVLEGRHMQPFQGAAAPASRASSPAVAPQTVAGTLCADEVCSNVGSSQASFGGVEGGSDGGGYSSEQRLDAERGRVPGATMQFVYPSSMSGSAVEPFAAGAAMGPAGGVAYSFPRGGQAEADLASSRYYRAGSQSQLHYYPYFYYPGHGAYAYVPQLSAVSSPTTGHTQALGPSGGLYNYQDSYPTVAKQMIPVTNASPPPPPRSQSPSQQQQQQQQAMHHPYQPMPLFQAMYRYSQGDPQLGGFVDPSNPGQLVQEVEYGPVDEGMIVPSPLQQHVGVDGYGPYPTAAMHPGRTSAPLESSRSFTPKQTAAYARSLQQQPQPQPQPQQQQQQQIMQRMPLQGPHPHYIYTSGTSSGGGGGAGVGLSGTYASSLMAEGGGSGMATVVPVMLPSQSQAQSSPPSQLQLPPRFPVGAYGPVSDGVDLYGYAMSEVPAHVPLPWHGSMHPGAGDTVGDPAAAVHGSANSRQHLTAGQLLAAQQRFGVHSISLNHTVASSMPGGAAGGREGAHRRGGAGGFAGAKASATTGSSKGALPAMAVAGKGAAPAGVTRRTTSTGPRGDEDDSHGGKVQGPYGDGAGGQGKTLPGKRRGIAESQPSPAATPAKRTGESWKKDRPRVPAKAAPSPATSTASMAGCGTSPATAVNGHSAHGGPNHPSPHHSHQYQPHASSQSHYSHHQSPPPHPPRWPSAGAHVTMPNSTVAAIKEKRNMLNFESKEDFPPLPGAS